MSSFNNRPLEGTIEEMNTIYTKEYCQALQLAYSPGFMSEGGTKTIQAMFTGIKLQDKKVLDFGSGLGGLSRYLAQSHHAFVTGLEINPEMIKLAQAQTPQELTNQVTFVLGDESGILPFANHSFDIVCAKGVIVHLPEEKKAALFAEFYRILTPTGILIINDWLSPQTGVWHQTIQDLIEHEGLPLFATSISNYHELLAQSGFTIQRATNKSAEYAAYNRQIAQRLLDSEITARFRKEYGDNALSLHAQGYNNIAQAMDSSHLICYEVVCNK